MSSFSVTLPSGEVWTPKFVQNINEETCIGCGRCHVACEDTSHQAIARLVDPATGKRTYQVIEEECVGCNLCEITCPVQNCITMLPQQTGKPYMNWTQDPRNPRAEKVATAA